MKCRVLARFNHQGQLHGGLRHFDSGFGAFVKRAVDDVSPADQLRHRRRIKTETGLRDVSNETGARGVVWVVEVAIARAAVPLAFEKVLLIRGREKRAQVMIEPPGNARRSAVLEVDNGVLVTDKIRLLEEGSSAMHQPVIAVLRVRANAFAVETHEERSRARSVKAPVVIENADLQTVKFLSEDE